MPRRTPSPRALDELVQAQKRSACQMHEARRAGAVLVAALHREGLARRRLAIRKKRAVHAAERAVSALTNGLVDVLRGAVLAVDRVITKSRPSYHLLAVRLVDVLALDAPRARALLRFRSGLSRRRDSRSSEASAILVGLRASMRRGVRRRPALRGARGRAEGVGVRRSWRRGVRARCR